MDLEQWHRDNSRYLAASVEWLRARLAQMAARGDDTADFASRVKDAEAARAATAAMDPPPALLLLAAQLGLSTFEREIVLLATAMELDTRMAALCAQAAGTPEQPYPTFALALTLFESPSWDALTMARPLRRLRIVDATQGPSQPLTAAPLKADERIVNYLKGLNALDAKLGLHLTRVSAPPVALPPSQAAMVERIVEQWTKAPVAAARAALLLGVDAEAKRLVAQDAAARLGRHLYRLDVETLPVHAAEIEALVRVWQRECALLPLALFVEAPSDAAPADATTVLDRFLVRAIESDGAVFISAREPPARMRFNAFLVDVARPTAEEQRDAWMTALEALPEAERAQAAARLAGQFSVNLDDLRMAAATAVEPIDSYVQRVWDACRERTRPRVETLAQRIDARASWNDLVVAEDTRRLLQEIVAQVGHRHTVYGRWGFSRRMNRGLGISALFAGESGTGKTMAAEVIAEDLRLTLYRIDLSQVVSKWIGETEKNLQRVFDLDGRRRRHPVLRRGRRPVRQAQRSPRQPRPVREHRSELPAAADGDVHGRGDPRDEFEGLPRPRVHAPVAVHRAIQLSWSGRAPRAVGEGVPADGADRAARLRTAVEAGADRGQHPEHRAQRGVSRSPPGRSSHDGAVAVGRAE